MTEIVLIGGYGSSSKQYNYLAETVERHSGVETVGISLRAALADPDRLADFIDGKTVDTHSLGAYAAAQAIDRGANPASWSLVAPPIREVTQDLMRRGLAIGLYDPAAAEQIEEKLLGFRSLGELACHPVASFDIFHRMADFDALEAAAGASEKGIATRVAFMESDGLFDLSKIQQNSIEQARRMGAEICLVTGAHTRFTHNPMGVLNDLEDASDFEEVLPRGELVSLAEAVKEVITPQKERIKTSISLLALKISTHRAAA